MLHQDRWEEPSKKNLLELFTYINTTKRAEMCKHEMNKQRNNYNSKIAVLLNSMFQNGTQLQK